MDFICPGCFPANPDDVIYQQAKQKAIEQSKKNIEPVAIYKEAGEFKTRNAFNAYAAGLGPVICEVVSAHHGTTT
jgi:hypothetical protein